MAPALSGNSTPCKLLYKMDVLFCILLKHYEQLHFIRLTIQPCANLFIPITGMKPQSKLWQLFRSRAAGNRSAAELDEVNKTLRLRQRFYLPYLF
jgi:hypothetical protein